MKNNNFKFKRGSEWRKWDLHVHTPESDGFSGTWEEFKTQLKNADCSVIGINDYFSVAGYKKLKEEIENNTLNIGDKIILPVVEMRMRDSLQNRNTKTNGATHFNFHIIFNDKLHVDDIETFIRALYSGDTIIGSDYNDKRKLKDKKVSFNETVEKLQSDKKFQDNFLIWLPYDEYGGIGDIDPNSDGWIKGEFIKKSHIIGSSNQKQIDFFLWKSPRKKDGTPKFTKHDFKKWFEYKKPCIKGSDYHSCKNDVIGKLKNQNSKPIEKFCWIKADPTFEGLKQIVYEPEDRVRIQEAKPEEKEDYHIIDKVQFEDDSFTDDEISINQNLTAIIGGKSTGKSILLRNIAQAIDSNEVEQRLKEVELYDYKIPVSNFIVTWKDGYKDIKNQKDKENIRKIIYIPQSYLNRLVDKEETNQAIKEIIENVLKQEEYIKNAFENLDRENQEIEQNITKAIDELFYKKDFIKNLKKDIKDIGDEKGIENQIKKIEEEIKKLQQRSNMTEYEIELYDELTSEKEKFDNKQKEIKKDLDILNGIKAEECFIFPDLTNLSVESKRKIEEELNDLKEKYVNELNDKLDKYKKNIKKEKENIEEQLEKNNKGLNPLIEKINKKKIYNEKKKKLDEEKKKIKNIKDKESKCDNLEKNCNRLIDYIVEQHLEFYNNFNKTKKEILKQKSITKEEGLEFDIDIKLKIDEFKENFIEDVLNLKHISKFEKVDLANFNDRDNLKFQEDIKKILKGIVNDELILKKFYSKKEAIMKLTKCWFDFKYILKQDGDEIYEMSSGKRSLVLLKLLIELDNSKCPILLDQPEDDLDNRSIYNDLVKFIKKKKKERQIIIVTHNPNLVVNADAECVIVAYQDVDESKRKFTYIQGALENSFKNKNAKHILEKQGIKEHICDILEGGKNAFEQRKKKYNF